MWAKAMSRTYASSATQHAILEDHHLLKLIFKVNIRSIAMMTHKTNRMRVEEITHHHMDSFCQAQKVSTKRWRRCTGGALELI